MVDVNTQEKPQEDFYSSLSGPLTEAIGPIADPMTRLLREKDKTTQTELEQKTAREAAGATGKAQAARQFAGAQQQAFKGYDKLPERPKDTITQDTQQGLQGLAMLLPVAGMFLGAVGNTSGVNAMNAMTGILKGYKEGNDQRIAFETKKYESAIKEWEANYKRAKEGIDRAIEIAKTNYQAGVAEAEAAARKIGSVELAAMVRSKSLGEIQTMMNKVGQDFQTAKNKAETLAARPQRPIPSQDAEGKPIYRNPTTGEAITDAEGNVVRPAPTGRQAAERPLMPSAAERKSYVGLGNTITTAEKLSAKLDDPVFVEKIRKYRWNNLFAEEGGKIASQLLQSKIPNDVREFIQLGNALRNTYYLDTSGKAVTGLEAMRNYNVVPQPGDAPEVLRSKFKILIDKFNDDLSDYREMYPRLPDLTRGRATARTVPGQQAPAVESESENKKAAREAIKRGAPRDAVLKRLQEAGEDISGL